MKTVGPRIPYLKKEATVASMMGNVLLVQAALLAVDLPLIAGCARSCCAW